MIKLKIYLLLIILLFSFIIINTNINSSSNNRQNPDDWVIIKSTYIQEQTIILNGNLTIMGTGKLTLDNITLIMNCSYDGEYYIEVRALGELNIINNSTIRSNNFTFRYDFYYLENSRGTLSNSTIMNAGWDYFEGSHGLYVGSDNIIVENCTLDNNYGDIWIDDSSPMIKYNKMITKSIGPPGEHFQTGGILLRGGKPNIINNLISNSKYGIGFETGSNAIIKNNIINNIVYDGISVGYVSSYPLIQNNTIMNCGGTGIGSWWASPLIINNKIINSSEHGMALERSSPIIKNSTIINSGEYDFWLREDSHPIIINTSFNRDKVYFKYWHNKNPSLTLQWYLKIKVIDEDNNSIENANVIVRDLKSNEIFNNTIDSNGYTELITCTEYIQQDKNNDTDGNDPGEKNYHTPHNITVSVEYKGGTYKFYQEVMMDENKNITMKIDFNNLPPDLTLSSNDLSFSDNHPTEGDIVEINATIHNQGRTKVDTANIKFYDGNISDKNQINDTQNIINLNPNNKAQVSINWNTTNKSGSHTIYVVIENSKPGEANIYNNIAFKNITIKAKNQNPIASIYVNKTTAYTNEEIIIDASASYDPDGYILEYYFDFGDGNSSNWTSKQIITHNYSMQGKYVASLKVRDNEDVESDNVAQIEITINKRNHIPIIENISANPLIIEPNGKTIITIDAFDQDFDDLDYLYGTTDGMILNAGSEVTWQAPETEGEYTITVKVYDGIAYSNPKSINITVRKNNTAPVIIDIIVNPSEIEPGETSVITVNATDPDIGDILTYIYNITDGYIEGSGASIIWYAPNIEGTYIITITVIDLVGEEAKDTISILVQEKKGSENGKNGIVSSLNSNIWLIFIVCMIILIIVILLLIKRQKIRDNKQLKEVIEVEPIEDEN